MALAPALAPAMAPAIAPALAPAMITRPARQPGLQAGNTGHVMNLGHGIEATTPEPNAALFVNTVHDYKHD